MWTRCGVICYRKVRRSLAARGGALEGAAKRTQEGKQLSDGGQGALREERKLQALRGGFLAQPVDRLKRQHNKVFNGKKKDLWGKRKECKDRRQSDTVCTTKEIGIQHLVSCLTRLLRVQLYFSSNSKCPQLTSGQKLVMGSQAPISSHERVIQKGVQAYGLLTYNRWYRFE